MGEDEAGQSKGHADADSLEGPAFPALAGQESKAGDCAGGQDVVAARCASSIGNVVEEADGHGVDQGALDATASQLEDQAVGHVLDLAESLRSGYTSVLAGHTAKLASAKGCCVAAGVGHGSAS